MAGEIISEHRARSNRNGGRHHRGVAGDFPRNPQTSRMNSDGQGNCGTPIYACAEDNPQSYALRVGTITQRASFSPKRQGWRRSARFWVDALAAGPATEKGWTD